MTPEDKTRLAILEVELAHLREDLQNTQDALRAVTDKLAALYDLLNQGKGVKWLVLGLLSIFGAGGVLSLLTLLQTYMRGHP